MSGAFGQPRRRRRVPSMEPLQLAPRRKGIAALSLSENPNTRQTVYLRGSLRVISDVGSDDEEEEKKEEPCEDVTHITEETNCILKLLSENEGSAQLYLGNLRDMQANLSLLIPQYLDNEDILVELITLRETIDCTLDAYAPIPEPAIRAVMKRSMGDLMLDLIEQDSESELPDSTKELCDICYEERPPETLPCGHTFCRTCIQQHLQVLLTEGKALDMGCLAVACDFSFTEETLEDYLTEKQFSRYQQFLLAASIRADPNKKCCPKPNCEGVLVKHQNFVEQTEWPDHPYTECCVCESAICFLCVRDYHPGTSCGENEKSLRLRRLLTDEEEIRRWQEENDARPCPRCGTLIVKSEGCNHMRCRTCGENFCWICGVKGATEGHFNMPGRCFGQLFTEENNSTSDRALNMASYVLFLPILGPAFGLTSAIEEFQVQSKKMNRRLNGVDYTIVVTGTTQTEIDSMLSTYCNNAKPEVEDGLMIYRKSVSVSFVKCRLSLISVPPSEIERCMTDQRAKEADGFIVIFRSWELSDLDDATILCDDVRRLLERPGVPGTLFSCIDKKKKSKKRDDRVTKKLLRQRASDHSLLFREVELTRRWDLSKGFSSLLKRMLKRWEPTVQSIIED